jgi:hypothetical protein
MSPKGIDLIYGGRCIRPNNICPSERATGNSVGFKLCSNPRARSYVTSRALDAILSATYPPIHPSRQAKNLAFSSSITSASSFPKLAISADNDADRRLCGQTLSLSTKWPGPAYGGCRPTRRAEMQRPGGVRNARRQNDNRPRRILRNDDDVVKYLAPLPKKPPIARMGRRLTRGT